MLGVGGGGLPDRLPHYPRDPDRGRFKIRPLIDELLNEFRA
jgi:hypothetical protein